ALASAIASTKVMKAQQVVKSESGEEMSSSSFVAPQGFTVVLPMFTPFLETGAMGINTDFARSWTMGLDMVLGSSLYPDVTTALVDSADDLGGLWEPGFSSFGIYVLLCVALVEVCEERSQRSLVAEQKRLGGEDTLSLNDTARKKVTIQVDPAERVDTEPVGQNHVAEAAKFCSLLGLEQGSLV
ncbi:hypothetical protein STEG23_037309, partial [Scotinomys teguina]